MSGKKQRIANCENFAQKNLEKEFCFHNKSTVSTLAMFIYQNTPYNIDNSE